MACPMIQVCGMMENEKRSEVARLNDLSYRSWEGSPDYVMFVNDILKQGEQISDERVNDKSPAPTVIVESQRICEDPLPVFFGDDSATSTGVLNSRRGWGTGFVSDMSDVSG
jgi:hypothetical protein